MKTLFTTYQGCYEDNLGRNTLKYSNRTLQKVIFKQIGKTEWLTLNIETKISDINKKYNSCK